MTTIRGHRLTTCDVAPDGETVSIHVADEHAHPATLELSADCLNSLIMSLPNAMQRSIALRYGDASLRLVYPLGGWELQASPIPGLLVLTVRTPDGFAVSFTVAPLDLLRMATRGASACPDSAGVLGN
jgi:hypothetical protein